MLFSKICKPLFILSNAIPAFSLTLFFTEELLQLQSQSGPHSQLSPHPQEHSSLQELSLFFKTCMPVTAAAAPSTKGTKKPIRTSLN
jgi:hypothetical protein